MRDFGTLIWAAVSDFGVPSRRSCTESQLWIAAGDLPIWSWRGSLRLSGGAHQKLACMHCGAPLF